VRLEQIREVLPLLIEVLLERDASIGREQID